MISLGLVIVRQIDDELNLAELQTYLNENKKMLKPVEMKMMIIYDRNKRYSPSMRQKQ